jgi:5-formyltetrahydrofolate cyclo-ligase
MDKQILREVYRRKRLEMSRAEVKSKSRIVGRNLLTHVDWKKIKTVCVYMPMPPLNEVDISGLSPIFQKHGIKVYQLSQAPKQKLPDKNFDLIIVPCLAFDKNNYRLGWGGGFYDKFLVSRPQALKIGLCFANGLVVEGLPIEPHDVKLDVIITEEKTYK